MNLGRRLAPAAGVCALLVWAAPAAATPAVPRTGQIDVHVSSSPTAGMVFDSTTHTWAPDGTAYPATLNVADLDGSPGPNGDAVTVSTLSTAAAGTASTESGNIDLEADPSDTSLNVFFTPGTNGAIPVSTSTVTVSGSEYNGPVQLKQNTTFNDAAGGAAFRNRVDGNYSLTETGEADFWGDIGGTTPLTALTVDGSVRLFNGPTITTAGPQDYQVGISANGSSTLTSTGTAATGNITFGSADTVNGTLLTEADGTTTFDGDVSGIGSSTSLTTEGYSASSAGTTVINAGSIGTSSGGSIAFDNAVKLGADLSVAAGGGAVGFSSTLDSAVPNSPSSLTDANQDNVSLDGTVGGTTPLSSVQLGGTTTIAGDVHTTGFQKYLMAARLQGSRTLSSSGGGAITFMSPVTGSSQSSLTTDTTGTTLVNTGVAGVPSNTGLGAVTIDGPATLAGTVHTSGDQTYDGAITFSASPGLLSDSGNIDSSSAIDLGGRTVPIAGSGSLSGTISNGGLRLGSGNAAGAPSYLMALSGANSYGLGTTVTGGNSLVQFSNVDNFGNGSVTLSNGGGLKWAPASSADISGKLAPLGPGGSVFDTNGNDVTFGTPLSQAGGASGTIVKQGARQLTLTGDNPGLRPWEVKGGTLAVTGTLDSPVTVDANASLSLSGWANGHLTVNQSGTLTCLGGTIWQGLSNNGVANYVPAAPTGVSAVASAQAATVSFTAGATRCSPMTAYEVTAEPGNIHASGASSPITVSGLKSGTAYTFTVSATNVIGTSAPSVASATVTTPRLVNAAISSPGQGHTYALGQTVTTKFSCTGVVRGALASCNDSNGVTSGVGRLNTSTPGRHTYAVTATASDGSTTTASISYTVTASNEFTISKIATQSGGVLTFTVSVPDAGAVRVLEKAGTSTLASATRSARAVATLHIRLTLNRRTRTLLTKHSMRVTLTITFTPIGTNPRTLKRSGVRLKR